MLRTGEIVWIEAQDYCVTVHSTRGNHLVRASLASLEGRLAPETFVRTHRMAIVNVMHVRETLGRDETSTRVVRRHAGGREPLAQVPRRVVVGAQAAVNGATAAANGVECRSLQTCLRMGSRPVIIASLGVAVLQSNRSDAISRVALTFAMIVWAAVIGTRGAVVAEQVTETRSPVMPQYDTERKLRLPSDYRQWILWGSRSV